MKNAVFILLFFISTKAYCQGGFYKCPREKKQEYFVGGQFKVDYRVSVGHEVIFSYWQVYDCSENHHLGVSANLYWSVPDTVSSFEKAISREDSAESLPIIYHTGSGSGSFSSFYVQSSSGTIKGNLVNGVWIVSGVLKLYLYNRNHNIFLEKEIVIDGSYTRWNPKKKKKYDNNGFWFFQKRPTE